MKRDYSDIQRLINRYFDGLTTLGEERELRCLLADPALDLPEADEARAVLGFLAAGTDVPEVRARHSGAMLRAAVMAGVIIAAGIALLFIPRQNDNYVAYADGTVIRDNAFVEQCMAHELAAISEAASYVDEQSRQQVADLADVLSTIDFNEKTQ